MRANTTIWDLGTEANVDTRMGAYSPPMTRVTAAGCVRPLKTQLDVVRKLPCREEEEERRRRVAAVDGGGCHVHV